MIHFHSSAASNLDAVYPQFATFMKGIFHIAAVDTSTKEGAEIQQFYKTNKPIIILGDDKQTILAAPNEPHDLQSLSNALSQALTETIHERSKKFHFTDTQSSVDKVVYLTQSNFAEQVYQSKNVVAVAFTAPWCGHCQRLEPEWKAAALKLSKEPVTLGWVDATTETQLAQEFNVRGYPTIKVFSNKQTPFDYPGERTADAIVQYMLMEVDRSGIPTELQELTNQTLLDDHCRGANHICVLAFLPHILDSGADGRKKYRNTLSEVSKGFRSAYSFLWLEGSSQPKLEQALELTFGYPALVAVSLDRQAYAVLHGAFEEKGITAFLHSITTGRQPTVKLNGSLPKLETVTPWDGKDGEPIEEEFDLSELFDEGEL